MNIMYLAFGKNYSIFQQAVFSLLTILSQINKEDRIIVVTDNPDYFNFLKKKLIIIGVNDEKLHEWKGKYNFFWRVKIKAIQLVKEKWEHVSILYLDADTFLFGSLDHLRINLKNGINMMCKIDGNISKMTSKTIRIMWKQMKGKSFGNIKIDNKKYMWNAGVVAISEKDNKCLNLALEICDQMCESKITRRLIEQFSLSLALNKYSKLLPADDHIGHYWSNKKQWNRKICCFLLKQYMKNTSLDTLIKEVGNINFEDIPIGIKTPNTRIRLEKKLSVIFPDRKKVYITKANK